MKNNFNNLTVNNAGALATHIALLVLEKRGIMKSYERLMRTMAVYVLLSLTILAQSGGTYVITQSVISNGGGVASGGAFGIIGTAGQPAAGVNSTNGGFGVRGGFWQFQLSPTAALVSVSGQVLQVTGRGIPRARVTLSGTGGPARSMWTNTFGYFRFDDVEAGQTYIVGARSKVFQFANPDQAVFVGDEITGLEFNALP